MSPKPTHVYMAHPDLKVAVRNGVPCVEYDVGADVFEFPPAMQIDFEELFDYASIPETAGRQDEKTTHLSLLATRSCSRTW
jgi:hypothetical protein